MNAINPRGPLPASLWGRTKKPAWIYLRSRTPGPPPFLSMNTMPLASSAARIFLTVSPRPPNSPSADSSRAIVGSEMPECRAKSDWDQPSRARAALTWRIVINLALRLIEFLLTGRLVRFNRIPINSRRRVLARFSMSGQLVVMEMLR